MKPIRVMSFIVASVALSPVVFAAPQVERAQDFDAGQNRVASPPPDQAQARYFPRAWTEYQATPEHNAAFSVPNDAPAWLREGVNWRFAAHNALPLSGPPYQNNPVNTTQRIGFAVGVSVVDGMVFGGEGARRVYAVDARTGKEIWSFSAINEVMNTPIVADGMVFAGAGDTGFSFAKLLAYKRGATITRGMSFGGYYALDEKTGKQLWRFDTKGEDMPGALYADHTLYFGSGGGHVYALDGASGKVEWKTKIGGFVSMSSINRLGDLLYVGASDPNFVYAIDRRNGKIVWKQTVKGIANTGMGDNSPTVAPQQGLVIQTSVVDANQKAHTVNLVAFAMDAKTGKIRWETKLGRGKTPPAYKAGVALVADGRVFVGNPATDKLVALSLGDGHVLWSSPIPHPGKAGAGRGSPTFYQGKLYLAATDSLYRIDPKTGRFEGRVKLGGRFGIVNPVIVGGTVYLANSWGWLMAVPLSAISNSAS